ncbi:hypothetical protein GCM10022215_18030 [Nocardioides fonticola]|uniref:DUF3168 domain-containing protein n=1 Tax=Nocardioides fonticola TaxID=450363 RepID=A0ABP7XI05_9ACTN
MTLVLVSADAVCEAFEAALVDAVPRVISAAGLGAAGFAPFRSWRQTPTLDALRSSARALPAGAITSPGLADPPERYADGYAAVFRIEVGVFDRGTDWEQTATKARTWAAIVRAAAFVDQSLGGVADGIVWVSESYRRLLDGTTDRTLGMCAVDFDVRVASVLSLDSLPIPSDPPVGVVADAAATVTTRSLT